MNKCIFLDRDGVINKDYVDYVYTVEKFEFIPGVPQALQAFKAAGYLLIVITNQSGIVKGTYKKEDVFKVHEYIQEQTNHVIDDIFLAPYHEKWTNSLTRKPNSLMLEKAIAKYNIDVNQSWMIGDKKRDLIPGWKLNLKTAIVGGEKEKEASIEASSLLEASNMILRS